MSLQAITYVWEHSKQKATHLLFMLALADYADEDGFSYAGETKLAKRCRTGIRNLQKISAKLQADGEIEVFQGGGIKTPHGFTNKYRIKGIGKSLEKGGNSYPQEGRTTGHPTHELQDTPPTNYSSGNPLVLTQDNTNTFSGEQVAAAQASPDEEETKKKRKPVALDRAQKWVAALWYNIKEEADAQLIVKDLNGTLKPIYDLEGLPDADKRTEEDKNRVGTLVKNFAKWYVDKSGNPNISLPRRDKMKAAWLEYQIYRRGGKIATDGWVDAEEYAKGTTNEHSD